MTGLPDMSNEWTSPDGRIRLIHADCLEVLPTLAGIDAVVTDPPYGTHTAAWDVAPSGSVWRECHRIAPKGPWAVFGYAEQLFEIHRHVGSRKLIGFVVWHSYNEPLITPGLTRNHQDIAIWGESRKQLRSGTVRLARQSEDPSLAKFHNGPGGKVATRMNGDKDSRQETVRCNDLWRLPAPGHGFNSHLRHHPNEKPLEALDRLCRLVVDAGDCILDMFGGSMTTAIACHRTNRRCIAIEKEAKYFEIGVKRMKAEFARTALIEEACA